MALPSHLNQVFKDFKISGEGYTHVGNIYKCTHDLIEGRSQQEQISMFQRALHYNSISDRRAQIDNDRLEQVSPESLEWVWETDLAQWLGTSDPMFWISGKPGSGKLTIMNFIASSPETQGRLEASTGITWIAIHFFFDFRAGKGIANTYEGMLRSLMLQLMDKCSDFGEKFTEEEGLSPNSNSSFAVGDLEAMMIKNLHEMSVQVCAFIDGLDEYAGNLLMLLKSLLTFQERSGMKMCLASRPEPVIMRQLQSLPRILMQNHNNVAVRAYLESTLNELLSPAETSMIGDLLDKLVSDANGVILWARLVADELIANVPLGASFAELENIISQIPTQVEEIYTRVLSKLSPDGGFQAALLLRLIVAHQDENVSMVHELTDKNIWVSSTIALQRYRPDISQALSSMSLTMFQTRLRTMLGGLIELVPPSRKHAKEVSMVRLVYKTKKRKTEVFTVRLVHKTLATYLRQTKWANEVLGDTLVTSYPSDLWMRLCIEILNQFSDQNLVTGADVLEHFASKITVESPQRDDLPLLRSSKLQFGFDLYGEEFATHLTKFTINSLLRIPFFLEEQPPECLNLVSDVFSSPLMALHGLITEEEDHNPSYKRYYSDGSAVDMSICGCGRLLPWANKRPLCLYPELIYAFNHRQFNYFEATMLKIKKCLSKQDRMHIFDAAVKNLTLRGSWASSYSNPVLDCARGFEILLADQDPDTRHLIAFLCEGESRQVPRYVLRVLEGPRIDYMSLDKVCSMYFDNPKPKTLLACWARSNVEPVEALVLRLNVLLQLGENPKDPCEQEPSLFHLLTPYVEKTEDYPVPWWQKKLEALLSIKSELPREFLDGSILYTLKKRHKVLQEETSWMKAFEWSFDREQEWATFQVKRIECKEIEISIKIWDRYINGNRVV